MFVCIMAKFLMALTFYLSYQRFFLVIVAILIGLNLLLFQIFSTELGTILIGLKFNHFFFQIFSTELGTVLIRLKIDYFFVQLFFLKILHRTWHISWNFGLEVFKNGFLWSWEYGSLVMEFWKTGFWKLSLEIFQNPFLRNRNFWILGFGFWKTGVQQRGLEVF